MSTLPSLPSEIHFKITEYGMVHPYQDLNYIIQEVYNLCGQSTSSMLRSELKIEQLRQSDEVYSRIHSLLGLLEKYNLLNSAVLVIWDCDTQDTMTSSKAESLNLEFTPYLSGGVLATPCEDDITSMKGIHMTVKVNILEQFLNDLVDMSVTFTAVGNYVTIRLFPEINDIQFRRATYLLNPRTDLKSRDNIVLSYDIPHFDELECDIELPQIISSNQLFTYVGDIDILREILKINPNYCVGSFLRWLRMKNEAISSTRDTELFRIVSQGIGSVYSIYSDDSEYYGIHILCCNERGYELTERYLHSLGIYDLEYLSDYGIEVTSQERDIIDKCEDLLYQFRLIRMAMHNYKLSC